jgi:hypothetical protein
MIPIKIQCGCGQRYAFDVEPVNARMASPVACPVCGADGTAAANEFIARSLAAPVAGAAVPTGRVHVRAVASAPPVRIAAPAAAAATRTAALLPGQLERSHAEHEARAKILWGDPPDEVIKFLMRQGISVPEAQDLVAVMFLERTKTIRRNGIKKVVVGTALMCVPVVFFLVCMSSGILPLKLFAVTIMVGLWGAWQVLKGTIMFFAPKSEPGDVAEQ